MPEQERLKPSSTTIVPKTDGNPEGKGANALLADWQRTRPRFVVAKPQQQILAELFTSMLILSAAFKFRPAVGVANYLYWVDDAWSLSLIAPHEWSHARRAAFAGTCVLEHDMTWTIAPSEQLAEENPVSDAVARFHDAFVEQLQANRTLDAILPVYVAGLPYYQRLYASALSRSLRATLALGDQSSACRLQPNDLLPGQKNALLAYRG